MNELDFTLTSTPWATPSAAQRLLGLTILWHPQAERIGEQCIAADAKGIEMSRFSPLFRRLGTQQAATPLAERGITRAPLTIRRDAADHVTISVPDSRMVVECNGVTVTESVRLDSLQVERGVVLGLGGVILVCLHWMATLPRSDSGSALTGVGSAAIKLRELVRQAAATDLSVLLLGESGSGKEVAAQAIHAASARAGAPLVAVNMAALNESLAAADLFGAAKGAYTGAQTVRNGYFAEADGGTLFLDEIGDTPSTIQPMLLRVLETGEYRPLGAPANRRSTARLIAATDQDIETRPFNQPLLRRLEAFVIRVPPLRERREDIGLLIVQVLEQWRAQSGQPVTVPAALASQLCNYDWPGNIRQLGNVVRRICIALSAGDTDAARFEVLVRRPAERAAAPTPALGPATGAAPADTSTVSATVTAAVTAAVTATDTAAHARPDGKRVKLSELSEAQVLEAMEACHWMIRGAAQLLGISRPSLYKLLAEHPAIRDVEAIPPEEVAVAYRQSQGDVRRCASLLKTPSEALRRHLNRAG
ncbi:MAG: sigma 54-interacting transcriptional regulator [Pseudomonadota bacterium]